MPGTQPHGAVPLGDFRRLQFPEHCGRERLQGLVAGAQVPRGNEMLASGGRIAQSALDEAQVVDRETAHLRKVVGDVTKGRPGVVVARQFELADRDIVMHGHAVMAGIARQFEIDQGGFEVPRGESLLPR